MFFFFDFFKDSVISTCLKNYINDSVKNKKYCNIAELFSEKSKTDIKKSISIFSDELEKLYNTPYPKNTDDLSIVSQIYFEKINYNSIDLNESFAILFWCCKCFKHNKPFNKYKKQIIDEFMQFISDELDLSNYKCIDSIIYDDRDVIAHNIENIEEYLHFLKLYSSKSSLFFRGHSKTTYNLVPSVMRSKKLSENEHLIYNDLLINCSEEFKGFNHHIDYLVKMQHYGLPTRLLDITKNPLVALYFACCSNHNCMGEIILFSPKKEQIKYGNSDVVAMISSLSIFSYEDKIEIIDALKLRRPSNAIDRFVYEIQTEKPGFKNKIDVSDLEKCFIVLPQKENNRILKQDGAFVICGMNNSLEKSINEQLRLTYNNKTVLFFVSNKQELLKELDLLSINESTLFPEIEHISKYISEKYK